MKQSRILRAAPGGKALLAEVHEVCTSKGDDARLGTAGAGEHKPIWTKSSPWHRTKEEFHHLAFSRHKSDRLDALLDLTHQEQHHVQHKVNRQTAWAGVCRDAEGKGGCSNTIMSSIEERGRV